MNIEGLTPMIESILFQYTSAANDPLNKIVSLSKEKEWQVKEQKDDEIVLYQMLPPPRPKAILWRYDQARIAWNSSTGLICVGWLNVDSRKELQNPEEASEARFGTNYFWPKYEQCKKQ